MSRGGLILVLLLAAVAPSLATAETTELPVIVTYEMRQARIAAHEARHDPRAFWLRQIVTRVSQAAQDASHVHGGPTVLLRFSINREGRLLDPAVAKTSGVPEADAAALAALQSAQPFPPMPPAVTEAKLDFTLPLRFR